eukprot:6208888-Pleurochrysis_carterae.AAC.1
MASPARTLCDLLLAIIACRSTDSERAHAPLPHPPTPFCAGSRDAPDGKFLAAAPRLLATASRRVICMLK